MNRRDPGFDVWIVIADMFVGFLCVMFLFILIPASQPPASVTWLEDGPLKDETTQQLEAEVSRLRPFERESQLLRDRLAVLEKENQLLRKGRGKDYCLKENNILAEVIAKDRTIEVVILLQNDDLEALPRKLNIQLRRGQILKEEGEIEKLRETIWEYEKNADCRFDYRLKFLTDADYRLAREQFERYFYLASVKQIAQ